VLFIKFCGSGDENESTVQIKDSITFIHPEAIRETIPTTEYLYKTIHRYDTITKEIEKHIPVILSRADSDSIYSFFIRHRSYSLPFGDKDSVIKGLALIEVTGVLDTAKITWDINFKLPPPKRIFSIGLIAGTDTTLTPMLMYTDRKRRSFAGGYNLYSKSIQAGIFIPINK
jgi:hypothetical protein